MRSDARKREAAPAEAGALTDAEREAVTEAATTGWRPGEEVDPLIAAVARIKAEAVQAERERIAREIESQYLGPDSGRQHDGREAPDAALRHAFDEGLEYAARIARGEGR